MPPGTRNAKQMLMLRADDVTDVWLHDRWDEDLIVWNAVIQGNFDKPNRIESKL